MLRTALAIIAGLIVAVVFMLGWEAAGFLFFPPPDGMSLQNEADLARLVAMSSTGKKAWVVAGWALASFIGGWVAARISARHRGFAAISIGVLIVLGTLMNALAIPHPLWMNTLGFLLPVPLAWLASRTIRRPANPIE